MDISNAYEVLHRYYKRSELDEIYKAKNFGGTESDTIKKYLYNAELLHKQVLKQRDEKVKNEIYEAIDCFESQYNNGNWNI